jgi:ABC-type multidrug transport system ATPase subunit
VGGLIQPTAGSVRWEPSGAGITTRREAIGWVGHEACSYRELTGEENVALVAAAHGMRREAVLACLDRVGALGTAQRRVGTMSRGQKQRIALARGIVHSPELLLLDEPFTGLDVNGAALLESVLQQERDRGAIVIVVSHDPGLAQRVDARTLRIERGRVNRLR